LRLVGDQRGDDGCGHRQDEGEHPIRGVAICAMPCTTLIRATARRGSVLKATSDGTLGAPRYLGGPISEYAESPS
jgi:hypothetical protein